MGNAVFKKMLFQMVFGAIVIYSPAAAHAEISTHHGFGIVFISDDCVGTNNHHSRSVGTPPGVLAKRQYTPPNGH